MRATTALGTTPLVAAARLLLTGLVCAAGQATLLGAAALVVAHTTPRARTFLVGAAALGAAPVVTPIALLFALYIAAARTFLLTRAALVRTLDLAGRRVATVGAHLIAAAAVIDLPTPRGPKARFNVVARIHRVADAFLDCALGRRA